MFLRVLIVILGLLLIVIVVLAILRSRHDRKVAQMWKILQSPTGEKLFDSSMVSGLPEPARRYFLHTIAPGAVLARFAAIEMEGRIGFKPGEEKYPFKAWQIIASPRGMIWQAHVGKGIVRMSGDDSFVEDKGAMNWYLWGIIPIVRAEGPDLSRSAAGRVALETPWLLPSALLLKNAATWEAIDDTAVRLYITIGAEKLSPVLKISPDGKLERTEMMRWEPEGLKGTPEYVLWIGVLMSEEQTFGGYTIPTKVSVTTRAGTPQENQFFEAVIKRAEFR